MEGVCGDACRIGVSDPAGQSETRYISGSAAFFNKEDFWIAIERDRAQGVTRIHAQKVKFRHLCQPGYRPSSTIPTTAVSFPSWQERRPTFPMRCPIMTIAIGWPSSRRSRKQSISDK